MPQKINFKENFNKFSQYLKDIVFPREIKCIFCGEELNIRSINQTCELCYPILPFIKNACPKCGGFITEENSGVCIDCKINNYSFEKAFSVFEYINQPLAAIHKLKYNRKKYLAKPLACFMATKLVEENLSADLITFVPIHPTKLKDRKFNQAELMAKEISTLVDIPFLPLCEKEINTPSQTELKFSERRANVKDSFSFISKHKKEIKNKIILLVDDVFTTGATSNEVCSTLLKAGASKCYVLTLAHVKVNSTLNN